MKKVKENDKESRQEAEREGEGRMSRKGRKEGAEENGKKQWTYPGRAKIPCPKRAGNKVNILQ